MRTESSKLLLAIRAKTQISQPRLAQLLGTSLVSISKWERGVGNPNPAQAERLTRIYQALISGDIEGVENNPGLFYSRGIRTRSAGQSVLGETLTTVRLSEGVHPPILSRLMHGRVLDPSAEIAIAQVLATHLEASQTASGSFSQNISAGKNTYTYDAHTYHTKVPPQGIAELIRHYLPSGGLVLDPFSGSGMTGVAARAVGCDCILNELSPAACFIANRFTSSSVSPTDFEAAIHAIVTELRDIRHRLYSTSCRECGRSTELLYVVWSYRALCKYCGQEFQLWNSCRKYGRVVREHKILNEFPCPHCGKAVKKASLQRTFSEPVLVGYKCCGSKQQEVTHVPDRTDLELIRAIETNPLTETGFFPTTPLPHGINLRQPQKHGLDSIDKFYTARNLAALSHIWKAIHRIESPELAGHLAFVFTSLYQRVTRLSEFRFWGGSGNTARFNVPFISNEPNVFITFERKARTIQDHLEATAAMYKGRAVVVNNSATDLNYLPANSIDFIFTDPPFGANINYSEMNFLWESWLGAYTDNTHEAIINRVQGKGISEYESLMTKSLQECYRVLREGHWMLLVFMNSSREVWESLRKAIGKAGFEIDRMDIFDKQHGTFKQFVSDNTAGMDLVLHCLKPGELKQRIGTAVARSCQNDVIEFLEGKRELLPTTLYLHVGRSEELDFRTLYSEWLAQAFQRSLELLDFFTFRQIVQSWIDKETSIATT